MEDAMNQKDIAKEARRVVEGGEADQQSQQPGDKLANKPKAEKSQLEGPAAYEPHENEGERAFPDREPAKKKTGEF
jgi:hypothetical protein